MKKKRIRPFLLACLLLAVLLMVPATGLADAGGFAGDSDYGGGSDWGGSGDWGSDSDWGSSSGDGFVIWNGGGSGTGSGGGLIFWIIVVAVIYFVIRAKGKKGGGNGAVNPGASRTVLPMTIAQLKEMDPNFSEEAMKEKIGNLYIRMQDCWQNKKWEEMRTSMTDALFNQMGSQLAALIRNKQTNYVERIAVLGVDLTGFGQDKKNDIITALVRTRIVDYTVSDETGAVVSGSKTAEKFLTYEWTLVRTKGTKTVKADANETAHCPNCGAPLDLNHTAKCEYCGAIITAAEYDWVISAIKGISQRTS